MRTAVFALVLWGLVAGATGVAQALPDFAGRWVLVGASGDPGDLAAALTIRPTAVDTDMSGRPMARFISALSVSREIDGGVQTETLKVGIEGGVVGGVSASAPRPETRSFLSVRWDDDCLVIYAESSSGLLGAGPEVVRTTTERWCMNAARQLVVAIRRTQSGQAPRSATRVYRRP